MRIAAFSAVLLLFIGCEQPKRDVQKPASQPFSEVIRNRMDLVGKPSRLFTNGIVLYSRAKGDAGVLVLTGESMLAGHAELSDDEVISMRVRPETSKKFSIGSVVSVEGYVVKDPKSGLCHIKASTITLVGQRDVGDPDFSRIADSVAKKADDGWDVIDIILIYVALDYFLGDD